MAGAGFAVGVPAKGLLVGAGAEADDMVVCGGGLCCCVGTRCGLGTESWPEGLPAELGLEEGRDPCPGVAVDGLSGRIELVLLSWPGCTVDGRVCCRGSSGAM